MSLNLFPPCLSLSPALLAGGLGGSACPTATAPSSRSSWYYSVSTGAHSLPLTIHVFPQPHNPDSHISSFQPIPPSTQPLSSRLPPQSILTNTHSHLPSMLQLQQLLPVPPLRAAELHATSLTIRRQRIDDGQQHRGHQTTLQGGEWWWDGSESCLILRGERVIV